MSLRARAKIRTRVGIGLFTGSFIIFFNLFDPDGVVDDNITSFNNNGLTPTGFIERG